MTTKGKVKMKRVFTVCTGLLALIWLANAAMGAAVVKIDDEAQVKIGFRVQPLVVITDKDIDGDGEFEQEVDFKVRRGRLRLGADVNEFVSAFMQTDVGSGEDGNGFDFRVIDAWVSLKVDDLLKIVAGENMAPASRQNLTSSGASMTMDRTGITYKTLTWGTRSVTGFANNTFVDADAGLRGDVDVRDLGVTLFGGTQINDSLHIKYYAGIYDGIQEAGEDNLRYAGRVQLNMFDAEPGYYNSATYMDGKKTIGIGFSIDGQEEVAASADKGLVDYGFYTVDVFGNLPAGPGYITFEAAYENLDLDDATALDHDGDGFGVGATATKDASQAQGDGYYVQVGYYINKLQPWVDYEKWNSDSATGKGGYDMYRLGATYFFKGHNANVKAGYEKLNADETISGTTSEDSIESIVAGIYVTY
jgi:Phosphate-selective porin O and P